jgi:outer membrane protein assembly factor BamD
LILQSKYKEATLSIAEKQPERYSEVVDEYYNYSSEYPNGKYIRDANRMLKEAKQHIK